MKTEICCLEEKSSTDSGSRNSVSLASCGRLDVWKTSIKHLSVDTSLSLCLIPTGKKKGGGQDTT